MWNRLSGKSDNIAGSREAQSSRRRDGEQRSNRRRSEPTATSDGVSLEREMQNSKKGRDERDIIYNGERVRERRRDRSPSPQKNWERNPQKNWERKSRDSGRERTNSKRERREKRDKKDADLANGRASDFDVSINRMKEATRGDFDAQLGSSGFVQFPGQNDGALIGGPPTTSAPMSSHVPDQFPGQFPTTSAGPYRPPLAISEGGPGLAADYYGDAGQSVSEQPGVRPQQPTLIVGAEPHLQPASSTAHPPPEPSASGGIGAAASFFSNDFDTQAINNNVSHQTSSPKQGSTYNQSTVRPDSQHQTSSTSALPTMGVAAAGAAAGYYMSSQNSPHEQRPPKAPSVVGSQTTTSQRPPSYVNGYYGAAAQYAKPTTPGKHSSQPSDVSLHAAEVAAAAYHHNHQSSQYSSNPQPFTSGSIAQKHRHRGPLATFVDFIQDPEGVAQFEEYTEYIGVCRDCFAPGSSPRDAPRKHHYRRRCSNERYGSSMRVDKDSRYWSSDNEKRRKKNKSWLEAGIAGYGLTKVGEGLFNRRNDFDDTYSVKPGHTTKPHASSPDTKSYVSRGTTRRSSEVKSRRRSNSRERIESGITSNGKVYKKDPHSGGFGTSSSITYGAQRRSTSRSLSRSRSRDRRGVLTGAAIGSSIIASRPRRGSRSPEKAFVRTKHKNREKSPDRTNGHRSRRTLEGETKKRTLVSSHPEYYRKSHKKDKKRKGFFSFGNSSSSSSSDAGSISNTNQRRESRQKRAERDDHKKAELAVVGLGAAAAALALENTRKHNKSRGRGDLVAIKESKAKHRHHLDSQKTSKYSPSSSEDDNWESASEGDADSINSDLAYGGTIRSLSSDSSGTSKWVWRWGSAKKRSDKDKKSRPSDPHGFPYAGFDIGATSGNVAVSENHSRDGPRITMHSNSSLPLQQVYPIPTSDASRYDTTNDTSTLPMARTPINHRPEPVPIQHPQPITPVSPAVYTSQSPNGDAYSLSSKKPSAPPPNAQPIPPDSRFGAYDDVSQPSVPGSFDQPRFPSINTASAVPQNIKPYSFGSSPAQYDSQPTALPAMPRRRSSLREGSSMVRFDLPEERNEKEWHTERRQPQGGDERPLRSKRQDTEEQEQVEHEIKTARCKPRRTSGSRKQSEESIEESENPKYDRNTSGKPEKSISWAVPAAMGAVAAGSAIEAFRSPSDSSGDERRKRKRQEREARRIEDLKRETRFGESSKEKSFWREVGKPKRISTHEDYADFFTPTELLSRSPLYKETVAEADADSAITAFEVPEVITIEPNGFHDSREAPAYKFGPNGEEIDPDPLAPPWVPKLKLISPTPQPSSVDGFEAADVLPPVEPDAIIEELSEASRDPQTTFQDALEDFQIPKYTVIEPRSDRDENGQSPQSAERMPAEPFIRTKPELSRTELPLAKAEVRPSPPAKDYGDDLEFAGTLAAGLSKAGFDPSIVIDDPGFRRRQSPPGSNEPVIHRRSSPENIIGVSTEIPTSGVIPNEQEYVESEKSPHMPGAFEEDEPIQAPAEPESKLSNRERRKKDKHAKRQNTNELPDKGLGGDYQTQLRETVTEPAVLAEETASLVPGPDEYPFEDTRSTATSVPSFTEKSKGKRKKRSKRDSIALEDEISVVSSPTTRNETRDVEIKSKAKKGGLFGLFGKSTGDVSEPSVAATAEDPVANTDLAEPKRKSKKKSKDRMATWKAKDIGPVEADADDSLAKDSGRTTLPAMVPTPASTGHHPSLPARNWLTYPEDEESARSAETMSRDLVTLDTTEGHEPNGYTQPSSFLGMHQELSPPPDISPNPKESAPPEATDSTIEPFLAEVRQSTLASRRSSSPLSINRIHETMCGTNSLPSSPTRNQKVATQRLTELHTAERAQSSPSPTAVPFHFRVPPSSPNTARTSMSLPQTPSASEATPTPSRPKLRPRSTEFKSSNEFRPLWLVSKHASIEKPIDEVYPSLPSSHTTSRSSSVHDPDEPAHDETGATYDLCGNQEISLKRQRDLNLDTHSHADPDLLDSQQPTPTASSFPAAIREEMQSADGTSGDAQELEKSFPAAGDPSLEDLPLLPSSKPPSLAGSPPQQATRPSNNLKEITLGAVLGASAVGAMAAVRHRQDQDPGFESATIKQNQAMVEKAAPRSSVVPAEGLDEFACAGADGNQSLSDHGTPNATQSPRSIYTNMALSTTQPLATLEGPSVQEPERMSAEQQRYLQEQDAQDAVDSWFPPASLKQSKKKTQRRGKMKNTGAEAPTEAQARTLDKNSIEDSITTRSIDGDHGTPKPEDLAMREAVASVKESGIVAAPEAHRDENLTRDMPTAEVVHRMSSAAESGTSEAINVTASNPTEQDPVETQSQGLPLESVMDLQQKPSIETAAAGLDPSEEVGNFNNSILGLANRGIPSLPVYEEPTVASGVSVAENLSASIPNDGLPQSAEGLRGASSSSKEAKRTKDRSKQATPDMGPIDETVDSSNQFPDLHKAPSNDPFNDEPTCSDAAGAPFSEPNPHITSSPSKKFEKFKRGRKCIKEGMSSGQDIYTQQENEALEQPSLSDGSTVREVSYEAPAFSEQPSQLSLENVQYHKRTLEDDTHFTVDTNSNVYPEDVPLPDSQDLDLLERTPEEAYVGTSCLDVQQVKAEPLLATTLSIDHAELEQPATSRSVSADQEEEATNFAYSIQCKKKGSKGEKRRGRAAGVDSYSNLDQVDTVPSDPLVVYTQDIDVRTYGEHTTSDVVTEPERRRLLGHRPSNIDAVEIENFQTEPKPILPDEIELPKDEPLQNDVEPYDTPQQPEPSARGLESIARSLESHQGALEIERKGEHGSGFSVEAEPSSKVLEGGQTDSTTGVEVIHTIDNKVLRAAEDQPSHMQDIEPFTDSQASRPSPRLADNADFPHKTPDSLIVEQQSFGRSNFGSKETSPHGPLPKGLEADSMKADGFRAPRTEDLTRSDNPLPNLSQWQASTLDRNVQESIEVAKQAYSHQSSTLEDSVSEDVGATASARDTQAPAVDSSSFMGDFATGPRGSDRVPLNTGPAVPADLEDSRVTPVHPALTDISPAIQDILAPPATVLVEEETLPIPVDPSAGPEVAKSPNDGQAQEDYDWASLTKKEKKKGKKSKKNQGSKSTREDTQITFSTEPLLAVTSTAEDVKALLEAENSKQDPSLTEAQLNLVDPEAPDIVAEHGLGDVPVTRASSKKGKKKGKAKRREKEDDENPLTETNETMIAQEQPLSTMGHLVDETLKEGEEVSGSPKSIHQLAIVDAIRGKCQEPVEQGSEPLDLSDFIGTKPSHTDPDSAALAIDDAATNQERTDQNNEELTHDVDLQSIDKSDEKFNPRSPSNQDLGKVLHEDAHLLRNLSDDTNPALAEPYLEVDSSANVSTSHSGIGKPPTMRLKLSSPAQEVAEVSNAIKVNTETLESTKSSLAPSSMSKKDKKKAAKKNKSLAWNDDLSPPEADSQAAQSASELTSEPPADASIPKKEERRRSKKNTRTLTGKDNLVSLTSHGTSSLHGDGDLIPESASEESTRVIKVSADEVTDDSKKDAETLNLKSRDETSLEDATQSVETPVSLKAETSDSPLTGKVETWENEAMISRIDNVSISRSADELSLDSREIPLDSQAEAVDSVEITSTGDPEGFASRKDKSKTSNKRQKTRVLPWEENIAIQAEDENPTKPIAEASLERSRVTVPTAETGDILVLPRQSKKTKKAKKSSSYPLVDQTEATVSENMEYTIPEPFMPPTHDVQATLTTIEEEPKEQIPWDAMSQADDETSHFQAQKVAEAVTEREQPSVGFSSDEGESVNPIVLPTKKGKKEKKKLKKSKAISWDDTETMEAQAKDLDESKIAAQLVPIPESPEVQNLPVDGNQSDKTRQIKESGRVSDAQKRSIDLYGDNLVEEGHQKAGDLVASQSFAAADDQMTASKEVDLELDTSLMKKKKKKEKKKSAKQPKVLDVEEEIAQAAPRVIEEPVLGDPPANMSGPSYQEPSDKTQSTLTDEVTSKQAQIETNKTKDSVASHEMTGRFHDLEDDKGLDPSTTEVDQSVKASMSPERSTADVVTAVPIQSSPESTHKRSFFEEKGPEVVFSEEAAIEPPSKHKRTDADPPSQEIVEMEEKVLDRTRKRSKKRSKKGAMTGFDPEEPQGHDEVQDTPSAQDSAFAQAATATSLEPRYDDEDLQPQGIPQPTREISEGTLPEAGLEDQAMKSVNEAENGTESWDLPVKKGKKGKKQKQSLPVRGIEPKIAEGEVPVFDAQAIAIEAEPSVYLNSLHDSNGPGQQSQVSDESVSLPSTQNLPTNEDQLGPDDESSLFGFLPKGKSKKKKRKQPIFWEDETATSPTADAGDKPSTPSAMLSQRPLSATPEPDLQQVPRAEVSEPRLSPPRIEHAGTSGPAIGQIEEQGDYFSIRPQAAESALHTDSYLPAGEYWDQQTLPVSPSLERRVDDIVDTGDMERTATNIRGSSQDLRKTPPERSTLTDDEISQEHTQVMQEVYEPHALGARERGLPDDGVTEPRKVPQIPTIQDATRTSDQATVGVEAAQDSFANEEIEPRELASEERGDVGVLNYDKYDNGDHQMEEDDVAPVTASRKSKKKSRNRAPAAEITDPQNLEDPAYQEAMQQRVESTIPKSRSASPGQFTKSIEDQKGVDGGLGTYVDRAGVAGVLGTGAVAATTLSRKEPKKNGKKKKKIKSSKIEDEQADIPEPTTSHGQLETEKIHRSPSPHRDVSLTTPKSPGFVSAETAEGNNLYNGLDEDLDRPINRDSAIHVSDSPVVSNDPPEHSVVRDSGYQDTEASPIVGLKSTVSSERVGMIDAPSLGSPVRDKERHGYAPQMSLSPDGPALNPLNISVETDPTYDVRILSPASELYPSRGLSRHKDDLRSSAEKGSGVFDDELPSPYTKDEFRPLPPLSPNPHYDQTSSKDNSIQSPSDTLPTPSQNCRHQPSPVSPSTKDRSSMLFQSSPSTREELANIQQQYPSPPHQDEATQERSLSPNGHGERAAPDEASYGSLLGGPLGSGSEIPSSPSIPFANEESHRRPLDTIKEYSPEDSPLQTKTRTRSYSPSLERGSGRHRRTNTQQAVQSPQISAQGTKNMISTDDIISRLSWPAVDEEQHSVDLERSRSRSAGNRAPSRQSVVSPLGGPPKQPDIDHRSFSGASIKSGDSINAIIRAPDQVRSASGLSYHSSGTPPLRRVDRSVSGDLRAKSLAKQNEAEPPTVASSSTYDPAKDKGKNKMADVYVSTVTCISFAVMM